MGCHCTYSVCYVPEVGGLPFFWDSVCVWCFCVLYAHAVAVMHVESIIWGLVHAIMVCYLTEVGCYGVCITLGCKCGMGVLGNLGVMVLLLCAPWYMCLWGGCDICGMRFMNPKSSTHCL